MKKILTLLVLASLGFAVVGCKKDDAAATPDAAAAAPKDKTAAPADAPATPPAKTTG